MTETTSPDNSKGKVLLIDDDKFLLDMYTMKFTQQGYVTHGCLSVADGIDTLKKGFEPDAVVFDLIMPERDGFALLESLRSENLGTNAVKIALTNQSDESDQSHAKDLGADLCVVKASMIPSEVVNMVGTEITKRKGR